LEWDSTAPFSGVPSRTVPFYGRALLIEGAPSRKGLSDGEVALLWRVPSHHGFPRSGGALGGGLEYREGRVDGERRKAVRKSGGVENGFRVTGWKGH